MKEFESGERVGDFVVQYEVGTFRYAVTCGCGYVYVRSGEELHKRSTTFCMDCQERKLDGK